MTQNDESNTAKAITFAPNWNDSRLFHTTSISAAPPKTKSNTIPWLNADSEMMMAAEIRCFPVSKPLASNAKPNMASDNAIENENSPAIVEAIFPP